MKYDKFLTKRFEIKNDEIFDVKELIWIVPDFQHLLKLLKNSISQNHPLIDIYHIKESGMEIVASLVFTSKL